jgi:multiple sugar transport system substrate-binding protein
MSSTRRLPATIGAALLSAFLLQGPAAAQDQVTLRWLEWWEPEYGKEVMDTLTSRFKEQTGITVERTSVPWDSMYDLLVANAQAGTADFDVLGMEGCCFLTGIDKLGGIEPLGSYLERDKEFAQGLTSLTPIEWRGETLMLNWYIMPYSYVYNVDLFQKAGVQPPGSWGEVQTVTKAINDSNAGAQGLGAFFNESDLIYPVYYLFGSRLAQLGGSFFDESGKAVFNSEEGVAALTWWKQLYDSGVLAPGSLGITKSQLREDFAAGKVAAMWDGPFAGSIAKQISPDIKVAYAPAWRDKAGGYQWAGSGLAISANSEHKDAAWQFLKFLLSDETTAYMTKTVGIPFASKSAVASLGQSQDPILKEIPAMLNNDPEHNLFLAPTPDFEQFHRAFIEAFQQVLADNRDPKEALDEVAAFWNEQLDQFRQQ